MDFKTGNKVVHKTHGVGVICGVEAQNFGSGAQDYYLLKIVETGMIIRFPKAANTSVIRNLASDEEIAQIFGVLKSPPRAYSMVWNRRKKELTEKIKSGSLMEIAEVVRDLSRLGSGKDLSFGEKEMLEKAKSRIINEISAAKSLGEAEVELQLKEVLTH